jgi:hypothetical protein
MSHIKIKGFTLYYLSCGAFGRFRSKFRIYFALPSILIYVSNLNATLVVVSDYLL